MRGLPKLSKSIGRSLVGGAQVSLDLRTEAPVGVRQALKQQGIEFLELHLTPQATPRNLLDLDLLVSAAFRSLALDGSTGRSLDQSRLLFPVEASSGLPFFGAPLPLIWSETHIGLSPVIDGKVRISLQEKIEFSHPDEVPGKKKRSFPEQKSASALLDQLPRTNFFSFNFWRGKLADLVMRNEAFIPKFRSLTDEYLSLQKAAPSWKVRGKKLAAKMAALFPVEERSSLPGLFRIGLTAGKFLPRLFWLGFGLGVSQAARLFIAGEGLSEALGTIRSLQKQGAGYILDFVAEEAHSPLSAELNLANYYSALSELPKEGERVVSLKLSGLVPDFSAASLEEGIRVLGEMAPEAKKNGALMVVDLEQFARKDITFEVIKEFHRRTDYQYMNNVGVVLQTYLKSSLEDLTGLLAFAEEAHQATNGNGRLFIRMVKGAYKNSDRDWVVEGHEAANRRFMEAFRLALGSHQALRVAVASHNLRTITESLEAVSAAGLPAEWLEFEMLLGMPAAPLLRALSALGHQTRFYLPVGSFNESIGYFMRRMEENADSSSCQQLFKQYQQGKLSLAEYLTKVFPAG
jgi:hypothetical protein